MPSATAEMHGFGHPNTALPVGVQLMVRSDQGAARVMFSIDTGTGFPDAVLTPLGLGGTAVHRSVDPDDYRCSSR